MIILAGCGGSSPPDPAAGPVTEPTAGAADGDDRPGATDSAGSSGSDADPCTLLSDQQLAAVFADFDGVPEAARTAPAGREMCSWQDIMEGTVLRLELDRIGAVPVPPADPGCSDQDCPVAGLGVASRVDIREVFRYIVVQLEGGSFRNIRIQAAGLDLTGDELIDLAASVIDRLDG